MTLLSFIYFIIASQGFLLTILLFFKKNIEIHLPLILFLLFSSIDFAFQFLYTTNIILNYPHIIYINEPLTLLKGSLIFMYIRNVYHAKKVFYKKDLLMLLPFIIYTFYYSKFYSLPANIKLIEYNNFIKVGLLMNENLIEWFFELLINLFFVWASINLLKKTSVRIKNEYSDISKFNYNIAKKLLIGVLIVYIFEIITILLCYLGFNYCELSNNTSYLVSAIILYLLGYDALMGHNNIIFQTNNNSNTIKLQELNSQLSK